MISEAVRTKVIESYLNTNDFYKTVTDTNIPRKICHIILRGENLLKIQDKVRFGTVSQKLGGEAEALFEKLVPKAINANKYWQKNNPTFDFYYDDMTIDVKFSSLAKRKGYEYWNFKVPRNIEKRASLYVIFLEREKGSRLENPLCAIIPSDFIYQKSCIQLSKNSNAFGDFIVGLDEVADWIEIYKNTGI